MWCVKFAINIKMCSGAIRVQLGGAVVSTAPFCFVGAVETTAPPEYPI